MYNVSERVRAKYFVDSNNVLIQWCGFPSPMKVGVRLYSSQSSPIKITWENTYFLLLVIYVFWTPSKIRRFDQFILTSILKEILCHVTAMKSSMCRYSMNTETKNIVVTSFNNFLEKLWRSQWNRIYFNRKWISNTIIRSV